jgi:transcriptional regulator GlxA family with amidase domain
MINHQSDSRVWNVGFILLENFSMMAFTGAVDSLVTANLLSQSEPFKFTSYGYQGEAVQSDLNIDISVSGKFATISPENADVLIVCGGLRSDLEIDKTLQSIIQKASRSNCILGGIWNGSYILAQAGVMNDYKCTIHPENHALMTEVFPKVQVNKRPYVIDRDRISSAGATSTLSMMLNLIGQLESEDLMHRVEAILNVDSVLGEAADGSLTMLPSDPAMPDALREVLHLMETHIDDLLTTIQLADSVEISRRQLERLFLRYLDSSPAKYYLGLRLGRAHQLLRQSNASIFNIAIACGFTSSTHFSHCFKDHYGTSPSATRSQRHNF